jgi:hypothetical protein
MPITISGSGTITGISAGGLPDASIVTADIADANVTPAKLSQPMTLMTAQTASGSSVDFTGIPSWAKRITVLLSGVSTNGTSALLFQIGAGSVTTSGYSSVGLVVSTGTAIGGNTSTAGFAAETGTAAAASSVRHGQLMISNLVSNTWAASGVISITSANFVGMYGGSIALGGTLDRVRITTVNGTDTFDAGTINVLYEG